MIVGEERWAIRLSAAVEADFRNIIEWTLVQFGDKQARVYENTIIAALEALSDGPTTIGARERSEIGKGSFTLHVALGSRRGWHLLLFRLSKKRGSRMIEVLRLLHDSMDLDRHLPDADR